MPEPSLGKWACREENDQNQDDGTTIHQVGVGGRVGIADPWSSPANLPILLDLRLKHGTVLKRVNVNRI